MNDLPKDISDKFSFFLDEAIRADQSRFGDIQVYDAETDLLRIVAHHGFTGDFLHHFRIVHPFDVSACGRAAGLKRTVVINDVLMDKASIQHLPVFHAAGFRAVKSVPLLGHDNQLYGVISTHFEEPKWSWELNRISHIVEELTDFCASITSYIHTHHPKPRY